MNSVLDKIKANSTLKDAAILSRSKFFDKKEIVTTPVPALNVILSGELDGGFTAGHTMFAGPSKHFKTLFALIMVKSYLDKFDDAACLLYDSEFGSPFAYFDGLGIDKERVFHSPITDFEELKFHIMKQMDKIERGDHVIVCIDSIGMLASRKEVEDALNEKSVADMTRAKAVKSLFRMVTPKLTMKNIPMVSVNHTYKTLEMFSKDVVGGGTGSYYASDNIFIIGRQQEKEGTDIVGYNFVLNVEKSRHVQEKTKIILNVTFEKGINKWSGLLELALEGGFVIKPKQAWYQKVGEEKSYRENDTNNEEFWKSILADMNFQAFVRKSYQLGESELLSV
jgi:RecA/RadA recombinase